jgi:hypothetical protein
MDVGCSRAWAGAIPWRDTERVHRDLDRLARALAVAEALQGAIGPAQRETFRATSGDLARRAANLHVKSLARLRPHNAN